MNISFLTRILKQYKVFKLCLNRFVLLFSSKMNDSGGDVRAPPLDDESLSRILRRLREREIYSIHAYLSNVIPIMRQDLSIQNVPDFEPLQNIRREDYLQLISMLPEFNLDDRRQCIVNDISRGLKSFMCHHSIQPESISLMAEAQAIHDAIWEKRQISFSVWLKYVIKILKERYDPHTWESELLFGLSVDDFAGNIENIDKLATLFGYYKDNTPDRIIWNALFPSYMSFKRFFKEIVKEPIDFPLDFDFKMEWRSLHLNIKYGGMKCFMNRLEPYNKHFQFLTIEKYPLNDSIVHVKFLIDALSKDFRDVICEKGLKFASKIKRVLEWYLKKDRNRLMLRLGLDPSPLSSLDDISDFSDEEESKPLDSCETLEPSASSTARRVKANGQNSREIELEELTSPADSPVLPPDLETEEAPGIAVTAQPLLDTSNPVEPPLPPELGRGCPKRKRRGLHGRRPAGDGGWGGRLDYDSESD